MGLCNQFEARLGNKEDFPKVGKSVTVFSCFDIVKRLIKVIMSLTYGGYI